MNYSKKIFGLIIVLFFLSCSEDKFQDGGNGIVKGRVVDKKTFAPIANARVSSSPNSSIVFTDVEGYFEVQQVVSGDYSFEARKTGYLAKFEGVKVNTNATTEVVFELAISTADNLPPQVPLLTTPQDNADNQEINLNLKWTDTDPEADSLTYKLILRNGANNEILTFNDIKKTNYTLTNLNYSTKYYWQISATDSINPPVFSQTISFKTKIFPNSRYLFVKKNSSNNVIFTADDTGNQLQLTSTQTNSFRPRKNNPSGKIAFIRTDGAQGHIYTMNSDGSGIFKVTAAVPINGFNYDFMNFSWNTNGSQIIYPYFDKLYRINADGSGLTMIYQTPNGKFISECDWSNNGTKIALKVNDSNGYDVGIYIITSDGILQNTLVSGVAGAAGGLQFSIDNQKLIFTRDVSGFQSNEYRQMDNRIFMYNFNTNTTSEIAVQKPNGTNDSDVRFSPNEADLIFMNTSNDGLSIKNIVKYSLGTTNSRVVLYTDALMPDWK